MLLSYLFEHCTSCRNARQTCIYIPSDSSSEQVKRKHASKNRRRPRAPVLVDEGGGNAAAHRPQDDVLWAKHVVMQIPPGVVRSRVSWMPWTRHIPSRGGSALPACPFASAALHRAARRPQAMACPWLAQSPVACRALAACPAEISAQHPSHALGPQWRRTAPHCAACDGGHPDPWRAAAPDR